MYRFGNEMFYDLKMQVKANSVKLPFLFTLHFRKKCFFVDLFVRVSNKVAVNMYRKLGYEVYRTVLEYYSGDVDEDAYGKGK